MNWKCGILSFLIVVAGACAIPFMGCDKDIQNINQINENQPIVEENPSSTNAIDRANGPNMDWFKSNSNYIWDGWKIK